jgi:hypothetical protein
MLVAGPQDVVLQQRDSFDKKGILIDGLRALGVIRPGRKENLTYGMIVGLQLPTGQVKSLFTRQEVEKLCDWVRDTPELSDPVKRLSYIFEFPAEAFTDLKDRGRIAGRCKRV